MFGDKIANGIDAVLQVSAGSAACAASFGSILRPGSLVFFQRPRAIFSGSMPIPFHQILLFFDNS
jgi:hypothetical protein